MPIIDPVFEITPNALDSIRRSWDPDGTYGQLIVEPGGGVLVVGQDIQRLQVITNDLTVERGSLTVEGQDQEFTRVFDIEPGSVVLSGSTLYGIEHPSQPATPTLSNTSSTSATLNWIVGPEANLQQYYVFRSANGASAVLQSLVISLPAAGESVSFVDNNISEGNSYEYYVVASDSDGQDSIPSDTVTYSVPSNGIYDLVANAIATPPAWVTDGTLQWPTAPTTTSTATVNTAAEFNAAASTSGTQITVASSFQGNISIPSGVTDIDVIMDNSLTINGNLTIGGASYAERIRWTGGNIIYNGTYDALLTVPRGRDMLFMDFFIHGTGHGPHNLTAASQPFNRVAFVNTTLRMTPTTGTDGWALYMQPAGYLGNGQSSDLILANCKLQGTIQNNRIQDVDRVAIVDTALNGDNTSSNGNRFHYGCDYVFVCNSLSVNILKMDAAGTETIPSATNVHFDRYDRYYQGAYAFQGSKANTGIVHNSRHHGLNMGLSPLSSGSGNDLVSWDGSTINWSRLAGKTSLDSFGAVR